ncbi:NAD-dependent epimerase/dehydratase family protein [Microbacterium sp.]|uniref:NAD-dependent epimerase/dehydratase family protein n=1 Tax=Microbacterium sp. TaxID=51671 RepID=UPI0039C948E2
MRVIVAGASGALGRVLVPELVRSGHEVIGLTRTAEGAARVRSAGGSLWSPTSWIATACCAPQQASGRMRSSTSSRRC